MTGQNCRVRSKESQMKGALLVFCVWRRTSPSVRNVTARALSARDLVLSTALSVQPACSSTWRRAAACPAAVTLTWRAPRSAATVVKPKVGPCWRALQLTFENEKGERSKNMLPSCRHMLCFYCSITGAGRASHKQQRSQLLQETAPSFTHSCCVKWTDISWTRWLGSVCFNG